MRDELIRDSFVVSIRDSFLSEHLQMDADLTLDKTKKLVRQRETVQKHQVIQKNGDFSHQKCLLTMKALERLPQNHHQDSIITNQLRILSITMKSVHNVVRSLILEFYALPRRPNVKTAKREVILVLNASRRYCYSNNTFRRLQGQ